MDRLKASRVREAFFLSSLTSTAGGSDRKRTFTDLARITCAPLCTPNRDKTVERSQESVDTAQHTWLEGRFGDSPTVARNSLPDNAVPERSCLRYASIGPALVSRNAYDRSSRLITTTPTLPIN